MTSSHNIIHYLNFLVKSHIEACDFLRIFEITSIAGIHFGVRESKAS